MEVVLDLYSSQHSPSEPLICMDEAAIQLTGHLIEPIEMQPGHDALVGLSLHSRRDSSFVYVL